MSEIVIQYAIPEKKPGIVLLKRWARAALNKKLANTELTIRIVSTSEMTELNTTYRHKQGPTNVLAFPFDNLGSHENILGDIVICADVVNREAKEQNKLPKSHWAHMVVHGTLHLQGYDHIDEKDAIKMEAQEIRILKSLGFKNPYQLAEKVNHHGRASRRQRK